VTVVLNNINDWWFNVSEWSWLPSSGTVIDNDQTGCSSGTSSATQTSASVTTTNRNDLIILADRATVPYSSGPTNSFVPMSESGSEQLLSAYYLPGTAALTLHPLRHRARDLRHRHRRILTRPFQSPT